MKKSKIIIGLFGNMYIRFLPLMLLIVLCSDHEFALAENGGQGYRLEEVTVTAQRRTQDVRDVPIALTVVSGDEMRDKAISDLTDMARLLPNVSINTDYNSMYMRGIGTAELNVIGEQAVAYILDDVYVPRLDFLKPGFVDLAKIEVLKGPQGTLYGRNAPAGVIKIDHGMPTREWEGFVNLASGDRNFKNYEGAISGPLTDKISFRLALRSAGEDGFVENLVTGGKSRNKDIEQARISIRADISDNFSIDASYYHLDYYIGASGGDEIHKYPSQLRALGEVLTPGFESNLDRRNFNSSENESSGNGYIAPIKFTYDKWDHTFSYVYGMVGLDDAFRADTDGQSANITRLFNDQEFEQISHELRVVSPPGRFQYVAGLFYLETDLESEVGSPIWADWIKFINVGGLSPDGLGLGGVLDLVTGLVTNDDELSRLYGYFTVDVESFGVFSQVEWSITDYLVMTLGARYSDDKKHGTGILTDAGPYPVWDVLILGGYTADETLIFRDFSPKISLSWEPHENVTIYSTFSQGYRAGSFNIAAFSKDKYEFDAETSDTLEAGVKTSLLDQRLRLNLGAFYTEYDGYQLATFTGLTYTQSNANEVRANGVEFDMTLLAAEGLILSMNVGYNDAKFVDFKDAPCRTAAPLEPGYQVQGIGALPPSPECDLSGKELHRAPRLSGSFSFSYESQILDWPLKFVLGGDANFKGGEYMDPDLDPDDYQEEYWIYNGRIGLKSLSESWGLEVHVKNISDELVKTFSGDLPLQPGAHYALTNPPRTVHAALRLNF